MIRSGRTKFRATLSLLLVAAAVGQPQSSYTDDSVSLKTNFFSDTGGLFVQSPTLLIVKDISSSTVFSLRYSLDRVRIPPIRGIAGIPLPTDAITGASRPADSSRVDEDFLKNRNEVIATLQSGSWSGTAYYSTESDYVGRLISVGTSADLDEKNTNVAVRVSYGWDTIAPTGTDSVYSKRNVAFNATLTQTVSQVSIVRFGVDLSHQVGFQSNPYRTVFVSGGYYPEDHPSRRLRAAGFVRWRIYLRRADASIETSYRLYGDDWGVVSHTLGLKFYQRMSKRLTVRYRYRYYWQSGAYFYKDKYPLDSRPTYFTADYKLIPLVAHLFGFKVSYHLNSFDRWIPFAKHSVLGLKYERYFNTLDFGANILQLGLTFEY